MIKREVEVFNANDEKDRAIFKNTSGIYGLIYNDEIIYVGQSTHIGKRIKHHMSSESNIRLLMSQVWKDKTKILPNYTKSLLKDIFIFEHKEEINFVILRKCSIDKNELSKWEEYYITLFQPVFNYMGINIPFKHIEKNYYNQNEFIF